MRRPLLALLTAGALVVAACGESAGSAGSPGSVASKGGTAPTTVPVALQFTAPQVGGGEIDFSGYAGQTVLLWFWAPT